MNKAKIHKIKIYRQEVEKQPSVDPRMASKHFDIVLGLDFHMIKIPVIPIPVPVTPFLALVFDVMDYIHVTIPFFPSFAEDENGNMTFGFNPMPMGGTVMIDGFHKTLANSGLLSLPPFPIPIPGKLAGTLAKKLNPLHFVIPKPLFLIPPLAPHDGQISHGSQTVLTEGIEQSAWWNNAFSCAFLGRIIWTNPTGFFNNYATFITIVLPFGKPVMVGGPFVEHVPSKTELLNAWLMMGVMKGVGSALKALLGKLLTKINNAIYNSTENPRVRAACAAVQPYICKYLGEPVDAASGHLTGNIQGFELPGPLPFEWNATYYSDSKYKGPMGIGIYHSLSHSLMVNEEEGFVALSDENGITIPFPALKAGDTFFNPVHKWTLHRNESGEYYASNKQGLYYYFTPRADKAGWLHLRLITDRNGFSTRLKHDYDFHLIEAIDSTGRVITFTSDSRGRIIRVEAPSADDPEKRQIMARYRYDDDDRLISFTDAAGIEQELTWNRHNKLETRRFRGGHAFRFSYDSKGRCTAAEGPEGNFSYFFEYRDGLTVVTDSMGVKKRYYHQDGIVSKIVDSRGGESIFCYDEYQNLLSEESPDGKVKIRSYDDRGNVISIQNPGMGAVTVSYNAMDLPASIKQPGGSEWKYEYDESGNLIRQINPEGRETQYARESGLLSEITDSVSGTTYLSYDQQLALERIQYPDRASEAWERNLQGKALSHTGVKGAVTRYKYDAAGRLLEVFLPDGNLVTYFYDDAGNLTGIKDRDRQVHAWYDLFGNIVQRREANTTLSFDYDKEGRLRIVTNESGEQYVLNRDGEGDLTGEVGFDGIRRTYLRDYTGRVNEMLLNGKYSTQYEYDDGNRISKIIRYDGTEECYEYDASGALVKATNPAAKVLLERDKMGRIVKERCNGVEVSSKYDLSGRRVRVQSSLGADIEASYNPFGDLMSLASGAWNAGYQRDEMGLEIECLLPGNLRKETERDRLGRVTGQNILRNQTSVDKKSYLWGANDRLLSMIDNGKERRYEYDGRGYLTRTFFEDGTTELRNPDKTGNLFETKDFSDRKYARGGQLVKTQNWEYKYDEFGNLVRKKDKHGATWRYEWNAAGMLERVKRPDAQEVSFRYDALGRRMEKRFSNVVTRWVWDSNVPLHEQLESHWRAWNKEKECEYWDIEKQPLITWVFEEGAFVPAAKLEGKKRLSIVANYMGTPEAMYREDGEKVWSCELNSYGKVRKYQGEYMDDCPFRYQGQYHDTETGLYYNRFRYYSPEEGMYISQDPIRLTGGNGLHLYVDDTNSEVDVYGLSRHSSSNWTQDKLTTVPTPDQQVVIDLARETSTRVPKGKGPLPASEVDVLIEFANQYGVPVRAKTTDLTGAHGYGPVPKGAGAEHIHINGEHVPVPAGYKPPTSATLCHH